MHPLHYLNARHFFTHYCPTIRNPHVKATGHHSSGTKAPFTEADKAAIKEGLKRLVRDIEESL